MKGIRPIALGAALVAGLASAGVAQAPQTPEVSRDRGQQEKAGKGARGERNRGKAGKRMQAGMFRGISLTDEQKTQIRAIHERYRPQLQEVRKSARANSGAAEGDSTRARPETAARREFATLVERQRAEIRAVLTPDQQRQFDQNLASARERVERQRDRQGPDRRQRPGGEGGERQRTR